MQRFARYSDATTRAQTIWLIVWLLLALFLTSIGKADEKIGITQGAMRYRWLEAPDSTEESPLLDLPLKHTKVKAEISGFVARVTVQQFFSNPTTNRIEAVYQFPLPENAAVHESAIRIGDRIIRAKLKEREAAKKTYEKAKAEGKKTSLLEQERPNIFTQSVANIDPGEEIVTALEYIQEIHYDEGRYRFEFPMTIGPRFIPGVPTDRQSSGWSPDTDLVEDASRITPPTVPPAVRSGRDIEIEITLRSGFPVRDVSSPSHALVVDWQTAHTLLVSLDAEDRIPNKDLVVEYETVGPKLETALLTHKEGDTGYFLLMVQPPEEIAPEEAVPKELVFVLDCSGSMSGMPMATSKAVMHKFISGMNPDDSFQVIRFSENASALAERPLPNTPENRARGLAYLAALRGSGGTQMIEGIKAALDYPADPSKQRMVFFLTDGYIGNEAQILAAIREKVGDTRLYSLGVGSSPNRYLIEGMAREGNGFAQYVRHNEDPEPKVDQFFRRLNNPVLTAVDIDWNGLDVLDTEPERLPDVFDGQPVFVVGRYRSSGRATVFLRGRVGESIANIPVEARLPAHDRANAGLRLLWARRRIGELMRLQQRGEIPEVKREVLELSLEHNVLSKYTAFVAVEQKIRADRSLPLDTILIPSELPEGVSYEGIFGEASVNLQRIKPGDPILAVRAPENAMAVLAEFPFGLRKSLEKDPATGLWICRFLVPRSEREGRYEIRVRIVLPGGDWIDTTARYTVDSTPPEMTFNWHLEGRRLLIHATPVAAEASEPVVEGQAVVWEDETINLSLRPPQGGQIPFRWSEGCCDSQWVAEYELPSWYGPGIYRFRYLAMDEARNSTSGVLQVRVPDVPPGR